MKDLEHYVMQLVRTHRENSFATQAVREDGLRLAARQIAAQFRDLRDPQHLKPKHITHVIAQWQAENLNAGTIKNRVSHLRWLAEKIGKQNILPRDNAMLGIARRVYVTNQSKALVVASEVLAGAKSEFVRASLRLQAAFGLRRAESIKIQPGWADQGASLRLKGSWCKGGKPREVPIRNEEQRAALDYAKRIANGASLIPQERMYVTQLSAWQREVSALGLSKTHGLRHAYAQARYLELTGWASPAAGGPTSKQRDPEQRDRDQLARLQISRELGHEREQITAVYLGR
jgi:site-specific recombinase XerC